MDPFRGSPRDRKLLHWINSLPLAACLLVDSLDELRLGDVLVAIVAWLRGDEARNEPTVSDNEPAQDARSSVARVVEFVAQQCSAADGDAMFLVNSATCVARVLAGDITVIAAVVDVLRRLVREKETLQLTQANTLASVTRTRVSQAIAQQASNAATHTGARRAVSDTERVVSSRQIPKESLATHATQLIQTRAVIPTKQPVLSVSAFVTTAAPRRDENVQPRSNRSARRSSRRLTTTQTSNDRMDRTVVNDSLAWMASLGVVGSWDDPEGSLSDGVMLCQLAAVVARRRGSIAVRHKLHSRPTPLHERGVLFPRGATIQPRTKAEKRHNLSIAWTLLKECRVLPASVVERPPEWLIETIEEKENGELAIWSILAYIQRALDAKPVSKAVQVTLPALVLDDAVVRRRPYITAEQMEVVKQWMKSVGVDPTELSAGIFEDRLRNGVAICQLLSKSKRFQLPRAAIKDPPKTLLEVRANIHQAISVMASQEKLIIPTVYLTKQTVEGIATGDKQFIYGLLWHLMQFWKDQNLRASQSSGTISQTTPAEASPPAPLAPPTKVPTPARDEPPPIQVTPLDTKPKITSLLLDVPACELVDEECRDDEFPANGRIRSTPWEATSLMDGIDDIVPTANSQPMRMTELVALDDDIVPLWRGKHSNETPQHHPSREPPRPTTTQANRDGHTVDCDTPRASSQPLDEQGTQSRANQSTEAASLLAFDHKRDSGRQKPTEKSFPTCESSKHIPLAACEVSEYSATQIDQVIAWLHQLGIELKDPLALRDPRARLCEFSSGVVLCTIVEKLEHMRTMEGVCRQHDIARANALHNIAKALQVLQQNKTLPMSLLRRKLKIYEGHRSTVLSILLHLRKVYGARVRPQKTQRREPNKREPSTMDSSSSNQPSGG